MPASCLHGNHVPALSEAKSTMIADVDITSPKTSSGYVRTASASPKLAGTAGSLLGKTFLRHDVQARTWSYFVNSVLVSRWLIPALNCTTTSYWIYPNEHNPVFVSHLLYIAADLSVPHAHSSLVSVSVYMF